MQSHPIYATSHPPPDFTHTANHHQYGYHGGGGGPLSSAVGAGSATTGPVTLPMPPSLSMSMGVSGHTPAPLPTPGHHHSTMGMNVPIAMNGGSGHTHLPMRMPIAQPTGNQPRKMGKEIKRRTKTGCLTCRKRRIKCDEGHPTCRNCAKSKRDCLGYDPIFKQQPGPHSIQPAPLSSAHSSHSSHLHSPAVPSEPYHPHHPYPGPAPALPSFHPVSHSGHRLTSENGSSLDPTLGTGTGTGTGNGSRSSTNSSTPSAPLAMAHTASSAVSLQPSRAVKPITMDQLFSLHSNPPQYQRRDTPPPMSALVQQEVQDFYRHHYGPGLDKVFETTWYSTKGPARLQDDAILRDFVAQCCEQFKARRSDPNALRAVQSLEARLVWQLAAMPRQDRATAPELLPRIDTIENLLTGQFLPTNQIPPPPSNSPHPHQHSQTHDTHPTPDEQFFWHNLGRFTSARDDTSNTRAWQDISESLSGMRAALNLIESRDVLYSVAVVRHYGGRVPDFNRQRHSFRVSPSAVMDPDDDDIAKIAIATDHIAREDQRGSNQVIQTICRMAIRSWALQKP